MADQTNARILVVFFSRSGKTRKVAEGIARATGADCEELRESRSRQGLFGWLRSGYEAAYQLAAQPLPLEHDVGVYDIVFVGSPTWSHALSSPVRGFLAQQRDRLPDVALFAVCAGHGAEDALAQMAALLPQPPLARLALSEIDAKVGAAVQVGELVESTLCAWERKRGRREASM